MKQTDQTTNLQSVLCRVCRKNTAYFFMKRILCRYDISYYKCPDCGFVQTEVPFWLEEAYTKLNFRRDIGMVDRSLIAGQTTVALAWRLQIPPNMPCLDWGAGTGLMVRWCRDFGMDFHYFDPYATNVFALGFEEKAPSSSSAYAIVTAFEVAEHFADPVTDFCRLFSLRPQHLLFSTIVYDGQRPDWWYFTDDGQHVAFYTRRSLELIGEQFGYKLISNDRDLHMFTRHRLSNRLLNRIRRSGARLAARYRRRYGSRIEADFAQITGQTSDKKSA